jgi:hypothetical protein
VNQAEGKRGDLEVTGFRCYGTVGSTWRYTQGTGTGIQSDVSRNMTAEGHVTADQHHYQQYAQDSICFTHIRLFFVRICRFSKRMNAISGTLDLNIMVYASGGAINIARIS